jgi:hypothetical protein
MVDDFFRGADGRGRRQSRSPSRGRGRSDQSVEMEAGTVDDVPLVTTESSDSIQQMWIADGVPTGAAKPTVEACKRRLEARPSGDVRVAVVVNDDEMREEAAVRDLYGLRDLVSFDVEIHERLNCGDLERLLAAERDFVHYIGHVDDRGLQCADGWLDARTLDTVRTRAFVLNACRSYEQGRALVDAGAIGGVVTLQVVPNEPASRVGRTLANLLNAGFALGDALDIIGEDTITGQQYIVVGDPMVSVAGSKAITPICADIEKCTGAEDRYTVTVHSYPSSSSPLGSVMSPHISDNTLHYLNSGIIDTFDVSGSDVNDFLELERFPVRTNNSVFWSDWLSFSDIC